MLSGVKSNIRISYLLNAQIEQPQFTNRKCFANYPPQTVLAPSVLYAIAMNRNMKWVEYGETKRRGYNGRCGGFEKFCLPGVLKKLWLHMLSA